MRIPEQLRRAVESVTEAKGVGLERAARDISEGYRGEDFRAPILRTVEHRLAYLMVRMPATYGACWRALSETANAVPGFEPETLLDLGSGPGTMAWAADEVFPSISSATLVERDWQFAEIGKKLAMESNKPALSAATWIAADASSTWEAEDADLVTISYMIGELRQEQALKLIQRAWEKTKQVLVIVEPGTKRGFGTIDGIRTQMIAAGAKIAAPCPHENVCPMAEIGDWCHFSQRVERTSSHRTMKQGELGYEDEKFSYVAFSKIDFERPQARIVRHPVYRPKQVQLSLCTADGLRQKLVTKSQGESYKRGKKADWGDGFND